MPIFKLSARTVVFFPTIIYEHAFHYKSIFPSYRFDIIFTNIDVYREHIKRSNFQRLEQYFTVVRNRLILINCVHDYSALVIYITGLILESGNIFQLNRFHEDFFI